MAYCTESDLADHLLQAYLDALEAKNPGVLARMIASASIRIDEALSARYEVPFSPAPETIKHMAATFAAYEALSAITSLIDTEAGSNNEFLPLQREYSRLQKVLAEYAAGKTKVPGLAGEDGQAGEVLVNAPPQQFGPDTWSKF